MTKETSTRRKNRLPGSLYGNFDPGNNDKLMITYRREPSHEYTMDGACGVLFDREIHFFGGWDYPSDLSRQHFVIKTQRREQLVKMTKEEDLVSGFRYPHCCIFERTGEHFPWFRTNVVILCFDENGTREKSCYSFDGELNYIGDSNYNHCIGRLTNYKEGLLTVGGANQKTEILKLDENKNFNWSVVEHELKFAPGDYILGHSFVTVVSSDINKEYVLLIGGYHEPWYKEEIMNNIFKFNGIWFPFGQLNKRRYNHNSIYWNGAVYVIGGEYDSGENTKMEIWNIKDSPDQFKTKENWPELLDWRKPHLFIVSDSFFPDH